MKCRALSSLLTLSVVATLLAGCGGVPKPPVETTNDLKELVQVGQTLVQVQELMTDALMARSTIYPAESIKKQVTGNWGFQAKKDSSVGDTDAPYLVVLIEPDRDSTEYFAVFFEGGTVMATEWFDSRGEYVIRTLLGNLLNLEGTGESE